MEFRNFFVATPSGGSVWKVNTVRMLVNFGIACRWHLLSDDDVLINDVDEYDILGGICSNPVPVSLTYHLVQRVIQCGPNDENWRLLWVPFPSGGFIPTGCFFLPAISSCPMGHYEPCIPSANCFVGLCDHQDHCGDPEGFADVFLV